MSAPAPSSLDSTALALRLAEPGGDLEKLRCLLAHKIPDGDLTEVLREAIRCATEKHGMRRGAVAPSRKAGRPAPAVRATRAPSAEVQREVWERDGGQCTFVAADGRRCDCRFKLEYDHIDETEPATGDNIRLRCRAHNLFHAEQTYGRAHMDRFRRRGVAPDGPAIPAFLGPR